MSTNDELLKKYFTEDGRVICQYCHKTFKRITAQHTRKHDMNVDEYKFRFPGAPLDHLQISEFRSDSVDLEAPVIAKPPHEPQLSPEDIISQIKNDSTPVEEAPAIIKENTTFEAVKFQHKGEVLSFIRKYLPTLKNNYFYKKTTIEGEVLFTFVTDMADPQNRVVIDFPDTFWHNRDFYYESRKKELLNQSKWKYIIINGEAPTNQEIVDALNK